MQRASSQCSGAGVARVGLHTPRVCLEAWGALVYIPDPVNGGWGGGSMWSVGSGWPMTRRKASREYLGSGDDGLFPSPS